MSHRRQKEFYEVEAIVGEKYSRKKRKWFYQVKWAGYSDSDNTWEPEEHLHNVLDLISNFKEKHRSAKTKKSTPTTIVPAQDDSEAQQEKQIWHHLEEFLAKYQVRKKLKILA